MYSGLPLPDPYSRIHYRPNTHAHPRDIVPCAPWHVGAPVDRTMHTLSAFAALADTNSRWWWCSCTPGWSSPWLIRHAPHCPPVIDRIAPHVFTFAIAPASHRAPIVPQYISQDAPRAA